MILPRARAMAGDQTSVLESARSRLTAYRIYLTRMLTLAGADRPAERVEAVVAFERALATVHWTASASRDADRVYNPRSPDELAREAPGFDWTAWLVAMELSDARVTSLRNRMRSPARRRYGHAHRFRCFTTGSASGF